MNNYSIKYFDGMRLAVITVGATDIIQAVYNSNVLVSHILEIKLIAEIMN